MTIELGYALSSEEHPPNDLVDYAVRAEELGFSFIGISDHFHPWVGEQGQSPFVWSVLGGIARATERIRIGTGVTCPTIRTHPGIVAQAAATVEAMMPGRFFLGVGSGENLNEHVWGGRWPPIEKRLAMLKEAVDVIRQLWSGESVTFYGEHYTVENARIYTLPPAPPPIVVAASGKKAAALAGRIGDGFWGVAPSAENVALFDRGEPGNQDKPKYGQVTVCWATDEAEARKTAHTVWPNAGVTGYLSADLPTPRHFEQAADMVTEDAVAEKVVCGPDVAKHVEQIKTYADAGFTHIYVHQVGRDQEGWFRFAQRDLVPALREGGLLS
jgi:G6PDH family F420-dependent oxidoreductase